MKNINTEEIIMDNMDTVETVIELVPEKPKFNFKKAGLVVLGLGAVAALGYEIYKLIDKKKKANETQEAEYGCTVDAGDFEDEGYAN